MNGVDAVLIKVKVGDGYAQVVGRNVVKYALTAFRTRYDEFGFIWDRLLKVYMTDIAPEDLVDRFIERIKRYRTIKVAEVKRSEPFGRYDDWVREERELRQLFSSLTP